MPPSRDVPPDSPVSWTSTLPRSSGSVSAPTGEEGVVTVGEAEVKMRKSKKKKKRSSMIFITEERERTSTLDCKRVRMVFREVKRRDNIRKGREKERRRRNRKAA